MGKPACNRLGRGQAEVRNEVAADGVRIKVVDGGPGKVGTVAEGTVVALHIAPVVEHGDQPCILLGRGGEAEAIDGAVIGGADEFVPVAARSAPVRKIRSHRLKLVAAVEIAKQAHLLAVHGLRDVVGGFHRVQVRHERNRDPVVAGDVVIAADDDPSSPGRQGRSSSGEAAQT